MAKIQSHKEEVKGIHLSQIPINPGDDIYNLAYRYQYGCGIKSNESEAIRLYQVACIKGHPQAMYQLAFIYELRGNYREAMFLYYKSFNNGYAPAMNNLGLMYRDGRGVPQNYPEAIRLYQMAIEKGSLDAIINLACMYRDGNYVRSLGVLQNYRNARHLYQMAIARGVDYVHLFLNNIDEDEAEVKFIMIQKDDIQGIDNLLHMYGIDQDYL